MDNYCLSVGAIVLKGSAILLVKHNYGSAKGKYLNPGGYLEIGELPEEAVVREVYEETGVRIRPTGMIAVRCSASSWYMVFKAEYLDGEPCAAKAENDEAVFMDIEQALENPMITDTAKKLMQIALIGKEIPAEAGRKNRWIYSVDNMK